MRKNIRSHTKFRRAFTIVELIITIALFSIVAGLVISFITYISGFSAKTEEQSDRVSALAQIRSEVDYWFSAFDCTDYEITTGSDGTVLVQAVLSGESGATGAVYGIRFEKGEKENTVVFTYPQEFGRGTVQEGSAGSAAEVRINAYTYTGMRIEEQTNNYDYTAASESEDSFRFTIYLRVSGRTFACEILEGGAE